MGTARRRVILGFILTDGFKTFGFGANGGQRHQYHILVGKPFCGQCFQDVGQVSFNVAPRGGGWKELSHKVHGKI